ncbi:plexin A [Brevipalpus obovatus]|uniref:plexin A n=1 Tax=Brevipalpus obovatus TaxID=246614 RepID=UPI003D9F187C
MMVHHQPLSSSSKPPNIQCDTAASHTRELNGMKSACVHHHNQKFFSTNLNDWRSNQLTTPTSPLACASKAGKAFDPLSIRRMDDESDSMSSSSSDKFFIPSSYQYTKLVCGMKKCSKNISNEKPNELSSSRTTGVCLKSSSSIPTSSSSTTIIPPIFSWPTILLSSNFGNILQRLCSACISPHSKKLWSQVKLILILFIIINIHLIMPSVNCNDANNSSSYLFFEDINSIKFSHMTINDWTGQVYVGGVNRIYQLSSNLVLEASVEMGPKNDSPDCPVTRKCPGTVLKPNNYWNKALVIDYPKSQLISCGSLFQGVCSVHKLDNVSIYDTPFYESVVANNDTASTVAFIAQGPPNLPRMHVLYVGASYTGNGPYISELPAVSSRSLDQGNMFSVSVQGVTTGTRFNARTRNRGGYPIHYVHGFDYNGFSYFLTYQKKIDDSPKPFISKLVRICQKDREYHSYTEVPLVCKSSSPELVDYNLAQAAFVGNPGSELAVSLGITAQDKVLFVVFAKSLDKGDAYNQPDSNSALCVYALSAVHRKFTQNIQHCFNGNGNQGLDFVNPVRQCEQTQVQIDDAFCGMDVNTPLGGTMPIEAAPVLTYPNVLLTSVAATSTHDYTVAFLGTSSGYLKRTVVESVTYAFEYAAISIENSSPINPNMYFSPNNKNYLYIMTERRVTQVRVQDCHIYRTCSECLGARDPYCGWCSLENKCSLRSDCAEAASDPLYWLSYKSGKCTTITQVNPDKIQRTTTRTLQLVIDNLPSLEGQFFCAFTMLGKTRKTNATRSQNGIACPTPPTDTLPQIPPGSHHFTAKLSVRMKTGPDFVATNFTFFDCSSYQSCTQCVSSPFPCDWCVGGHRCTYDTGENCRNDILVTGINQVGPSIRSGPGFCPRINATSATSSEVLAPSGSAQRIQVKVENIPNFIVSTRFVCQFNIEGRVRQVNAQLLGDTIYCEQMSFQYSTNAPNITAAFAVIWDGSKPLDNPQNIHVIVYRCQGMANNCGICLELPEKYNCGWCYDQCDVQDKCEERGSKEQKVSWLNKQQTCPDPQIIDFYPKSGPFEGGTNVTIEGINLGRNFEDIASGVNVAHEQNGVTVGLMPCIPFRKLYVKTSRITCQIRSPNISRYNGNEVKGPILVKVQTEYQAKSKEFFKFQSPLITSIDPTIGPKSGGTTLKIWGLYLNAGSSATAFLGNIPCKVIKRVLNMIQCITGARSEPGSEKVKIHIDYGMRTLESTLFIYTPDPFIQSVDSGLIQGSKAVRGIPGGGIRIYVKGTNLRSVQHPKFYVEVEGQKYLSNCSAESDTLMRCRSPTVPMDKLNFPESDELIELDYGFIMDNVTSVMNLSKRRSNPFAKFKMFRNPEIHKFNEPERIKYYKSDYLTINGKNLDRAAQESDVVVKIGSKTCDVTSLSRTQLTCRPPTVQPPAMGSNGEIDEGAIPDVIVHLGDQLQFKIGKLSYEKPPSPDANLPKPLLIVVIMGVCILIVVVIIILIAYKRKSTESNRVLRSMQEQMDVLELRVASECKEAFAELQTEMTDLTGDVTATRIPFHDYRIYAIKVLFPNDMDHPVLRDMDIDPIRRQAIEKGLKAFGQLVMNKTFLLIFIRTLESNRNFSMRERVDVASYIMVALQGKMEYCTDILKTLLADLIERCMEGKSHPKLLLRRTESVAEKMLSSWFTFLLYKFLRECAGEPLYLLFRAIKQQVDKGPVDWMTSEARYSLSEEKLIRQSIEYKPLTIYVIMSTQTTNQYVSGMEQIIQDQNIEIPVKVLDCDTITQVKEKCLDAIYRNVPYSARPSKDDLDLEWRTGQSGRLILSDEDATTKIENEWRRLNTLAHYRVQDGAFFSLVPKQSSMYNLSILSEKMDKHKYETLNNYSYNKVCSPPLSRATSPLNHDIENGGYKQWHLVRHHDEEQNRDERNNRLVTEIYLTRLLATKGTLQKFVDDLFETIFSTAHRGSALPLAIKYMFDFLDDQAINHGITDLEIVHTWKSNSLPLRFWVNLIKNPNFVFDINKSNTVDSCLSVVAQTFMDACSKSDHRLGKDSPSSKLLYAKDIPIYKEWVGSYYRNIKTMPAISDQDMNSMLAQESRLHAHEFNTNVSLQELYNFAVKYNDQLMLNLEEDEFSRNHKLAYRLNQVHAMMPLG